MSFYSPYHKGTDSGGGAFPGGSMRICPSGQTQPQPDPKQQPQTQSMQGGMPGGINYSQQQSRTPQYYSSRPSQPRVQARPMMTQAVPSSSMTYQPPAAILSHQYLPQPMPTAGVLLPYAGPTIQSGRQHGHGGGQAVGTTATPQGNYFPTQQQIFMTQHATLGNPFTHQFSPHAGTPHYVYPQLRNAYSTPNSGPHQGVPTQPPPQQPPQQYTVDAVPNAGGGGPTAPAGSGVLITHGHPPGPPQSTMQQKRRRTPLSIIDPSSGRNVIEDYLSEKSQTVETNTSTAPVPTGVAADFAARVAAVATEPTCPEEEEEEEEEEEVTEEPEIEIVNGPDSTPAPLALAPPSSAVEVIPPPTVVPPMIQSQTQPSVPQPPQVLPHHQPQPQVVPQPLSQSQQIPTVSAMTDSPPVELPRPKVPSVAILPGRKSTPVPQNVLEPSKKKEKKIVGVTGGLPPHKEEPEETKKSSFAEALNLKNITQSNMIKTAEPLQSMSSPPVNNEAETNGEPEISPVPPTAVPAPQPAKHHEKQKQHEEHATHQQHDRGKALSRPKQKKKANLKELNRRGQEKEGGSDMDAFTSLPPMPVATNASSLDSKASSSPPSTPLVQQSEVVAPQPVDQAPVVNQQPPTVITQQQPPLPSPTVPDSPTIPQATIIPPPVINKNVDNEQDEGVGEEEVAEEVEIMVAVKNEENSKASAATKEKVNDADEKIVIETTVIERSKPPVLKYTYKEDQWSPLNPEGKKVYDRDFLLGLRTEALSIKRPDIEDCDIIKTESSNNNNVSSNNNNRRLHGSNSMGMSREDRFITPPFLSRASSSQRGGMMGKRGSQQGRPGGGGGGGGRSGKIMYSSSQYKPDVDEDLHWAGKQGWKPERCKSPPKLSEEEIKTENLYKKIRGILNKLTPQKFDTLLEQITRLPIDTQDRLKGVVELVFDKAVDEPSFSIAYAKLCQNLSKMSVKIVKEESQGNENSQPHAEASFRKVLLTRCQQMFEKKRKEETGEDGKKSDDERIAELQQSLTIEDNKEKKKELQLLLDEEERKIRVKYVGLARFIGELFKLNMLTAGIMHGCIKTLLEKIEEESLECLCKLLTTVGKELESQCDQKDMDEYFGKMRKLSQKSSNSKVSSRVRFMLQDVIELRSNRWVPRRDENNPKTMEQIQRDAEREAENAAMSSIANRSKHSDRDMDRRRGQRSGTNQDPEGWSTPKPGFRSYAFDQSKLQHIKGLDNETSSVLGCPTQFSQWNLGSNAKRDVPKFAATANKFALLGQDQEKKMSSMTRKVTPSSSQEKERAVQGVRDAFIRDERGNRGQGSNPPSRENSRVRGKTPSMTHVPVVEQEPPPPPVAKEPPMDPEACKKKSKVIFEEWLANHNVQESVDCILESFPADAMLFVRSLLDSVLEGKPLARTSFGELLADLLSRKIVSASDVTKELQLIIESGEDFMIDLPLFWTYLAELLVPLLVKSVYTFADLKAACETCKTSHMTRTLAEIFRQLTKEKGPYFIKQQWESSDVQFVDFFPESDVDNFIKNNKCGFLIGEGEVETGESLPMDQVEEKLLNLLKSDNNDKIFDQICDWIKANVGNRTQGTDFIRALTRAVIKANIKNDHLNSSNLMKHEKLIKRFVDANETRELACLHGIQNLVVVQMLSPQGLLMEIFQSLWENGIISHEAFMKWKSCEDTKYEAEGKGVAIASLSPFFVSLSEQDDTDDESS